VAGATRGIIDMRSHRAKAWTYAVLIGIGLLSALPNVLPSRLAAMLPDWYAAQTITLGLDLRGGSHLLLEVETEKLAANAALGFAERVSRELDSVAISHGAPEAAPPASYRIPLRDAGDSEHAAAIARELASQSGQADFTVNRGPTALSLTPTAEYLDTLAGDAVERSVEIVQRRLNASGVVEPLVARQGENAIVVQLPGVDDPHRIRELLGTTAKLTFHLVTAEGAARESTVTLPGTTPEDRYTVVKRPALDGAHLADASVGFHPTTHEPMVHFELDGEGGDRFAEITRDNVGRPLAIVLDGRIISAPVIQGVIAGGSGEISGGFSVAEATDLALLLRAGALPAPLDVIEERTVGPDLGSDSIQMGLTTGLIGAALVFALMVALYGRWGLIANAALLVNVILTFGALGLIGATLTLPGIAGIVLSIGMAVDANILINERIREELQRGRKPLAALDAGFRRAYGTIVDANVTTLIATSLLFTFGSGTVKGFAVTMAIGLGMSMFTAIALTRLVMEWRIRRRGRRPLVIAGLPWLERIRRDTPIGFMRARAAGLALSAVLSLASLALLVHPGLERGVDFAGGTLVEVQTDREVAVQDLRQSLSGHGLEDAAIQEFGAAGSFLIRSALDAPADSAGVERIKAAVRAVADDASFPRVEMVGPRVSQAFADTAILAVVLAGLGMFGYLWLRFEWPFAVAAILTLALDLTKTLGFFALLGLEFNLTAVAALLTLIGYSVNDKVVVFDRIRENLRADPDQPLIPVFDASITATLRRTLLTSATTFLAILPMGVAGGAAVASFALPMLFGIVVGTSSSIFIAAPIVLLLAQRYCRERRLFRVVEDGPDVELLAAVPRSATATAPPRGAAAPRAPQRRDRRTS
jgi:SecD/SecF fusion protein